jgi:phosphate transport system substrate-binding protein
MKTPFRSTSLAAIAASILAALAANGQQPLIKIDGSSTVYPVTEAVAEEFQSHKGGKVNVTVGISGTGGGFKKFVRGEIDIADASRPISETEMAECAKNGIQYVELPICFDALTVAVNPKNDWAQSMTVTELKKLWEPEAQGKITKWSQVREGWPDETIKLFGAGADSGTFDYFTEAIVGKAKSSRGDFTASEDDNTLVQGVEGDKYALGYIPFAYYAAQKDRLKAVAIDWEKGEGAQMPTMENVAKGVYNPLSRPIFIYVNAKSLDRAEVSEFVQFYLDNVKEHATEVKYLPLPDNAMQMVKERFTKKQTGTGFGGEAAIGLPVEELLKREPKS